MFIVQFKVASGEGAALELRLRLLANREPKLRRFATKKMNGMEPQIIRLFREDLREEECAQLRLCVELRNKILHCDFPSARQRLKDLGAPQEHAGTVVQFDLVPGEENRARRVVDIPEHEPPDIFGWLLEMGSGGDFVRAADLFFNVSKIVDRLAWVSSTRDLPLPAP